MNPTAHIHQKNVYPFQLKKENLFLRLVTRQKGGQAFFGSFDVGSASNFVELVKKCARV